MPFLRNNVLTSYSPLIVPGYLFLMDIPGAKHFLLRILSVRGVVVSLSKIALQQLISMTSLWSLRATPQVQLALRWPQLHAQCLTWTYMYRKKEHNIIWIDFTRLMDSDVFYRQKSEKKTTVYFWIIAISYIDTFRKLKRFKLVRVLQVILLMVRLV